MFFSGITEIYRQNKQIRILSSYDILYICKRIFNPRFVSDEATNRRILVKQLVHSGIIFENDEYSQIGWLDFVMLLFKYSESTEHSRYSFDNCCYRNVNPRIVDGSTPHLKSIALYPSVLTDCTVSNIL